MNRLYSRFSVQKDTSSSSFPFSFSVRVLFRSVVLCMIIFASIHHLNYLLLLLFSFWWTGSSDTGQSDVEERVKVSFNFRPRFVGWLLHFGATSLSFSLLLHPSSLTSILPLLLHLPLLLLFIALPARESDRAPLGPGI